MPPQGLKWEKNLVFQDLKLILFPWRIHLQSEKLKLKRLSLETFGFSGCEKIKVKARTKVVMMASHLQVIHLDPGLEILSYEGIEIKRFRLCRSYHLLELQNLTFVVPKQQCVS